MRTLSLLALMVAPASLTLGGCATQRDAQLGAVVQNNVIAQVVDLEPVYAGVPIEGGNAARTVEGVRRYNNGAVKQLYSGSVGRSAPQ
jgi:hypothetical protein